MKKFLKNAALLLTVPALAAGLCFAACGAVARLPDGVSINGADVGGMPRARAVAEVRENILSDLKGRRLSVFSEEHVYTYSYPEISFRDDAKAVVYSISRAGEYRVQANCFLNGLDEVVSGICAAEFKEREEPSAHFNSSGGEAFCYDEGTDGAAPDGARLRADILRSLGGRGYGCDFAPVKLSVLHSARNGSVEELKGCTALLSSYTTYFDGENSPRVSNIKLASGKISGCVLPPGESFSFNARVGARTEKNGFKKAKIIEDGRFVYGVGGGVCQVSTTLYNAALLAGLEVTEYHPHSLSVSYIAPSRDAMVSGTYSDLKFKNTAQSNVYVRVLAGDSYVRCELYGLPDGACYSLESVVTGGEEGAVESECYLVCARGENVERRLLRKDKYLPAREQSGNVKQGQKAEDGQKAENSQKTENGQKGENGQKAGNDPKT